MSETVARRAAHVEGDEVRRAGQTGRPARAGHPSGRAGEHGARRDANGLLDRSHAPVGLHHQDRPFVPGRGQPLPEPREIAGEQGADVGVHHRGRGAFVLLDPGEHFARQADVGAGQLLFEEGTGHAFVPAVPVGVQVADRRRGDPGPAQGADRLAQRRGVEGGLDPAVRADALAHAEAKMPGHERCLARQVHVVAVGLQALAHFQHVAVALGRQEAHLGPLALDEGVGGDGHAVDDRVGLPEQAAERCAEGVREPGEAVHDPGGLIGRGARRLGERDPPVLVGRDHVRERAPHVHTDPVPGPGFSAIHLFLFSF